MTRTAAVVLFLLSGLPAPAQEESVPPEAAAPAPPERLALSAIYDDIRKEGCAGVQYEMFLNERNGKVYSKLADGDEVIMYFHVHGSLSSAGYPGPTYSDMQRMKIFGNLKIEMIQLVVNEKYAYIVHGKGAMVSQKEEMENFQDASKFPLTIFEYLILSDNNLIKNESLKLKLSEKSVKVLKDFNLNPVPHSVGFFEHEEHYIGHVLYNEGGVFLQETDKKKWKKLLIIHPTEIYVFFDKTTGEIKDIRLAHCR